uniref:Uncharacterized protein n=1 Tax=Branchiostoma floridae TaxID=7739 RepID=C3Z1V5_BRAFL|eukprot:XP_002597460.1 hypothetical protein BRAFLDRAFT_80533 [Branchiostoma floridae]
MLPISDFQKIGIGLTGFGTFFLILGMLLFFDTALLAIGNVSHRHVCGAVCGFFPVAISFIRRIPVLGMALDLPGISTMSEVDLKVGVRNPIQVRMPKNWSGSQTSTESQRHNQHVEL